MNKLNEGEVEKLIALVKQKPLLYDKLDKNYKKMDNKEKCWQEISEIVGANKNDCKTAWKSLRDQFMKCLKERKGVSGQEATDRKPYKYFHELLFLKDSLQPRKTESNVTAAIEVENTDTTPSVPNAIEEITISSYSCFGNEAASSTDIFDSFDDVVLSPPPAFRDSSSGGANSAKKKTCSEDEDFKTFLKDLLETQRDEHDDIDKFFLVISTMVKKYNLTVSQLSDIECKTMVFVREELEKLQNRYC